VSQARLEFFYDFSCPYAYLASTQIERIAKRANVSVEYKPFLLGGVFRALGDADGPMGKLAPPRARMNGLDMLRWAEHWSVPLNMPKTHPNRTVTALRATLASGDVPRASHALFRAYWVDGSDLSDRDVVARALDAAGFDGAALVARADDYKDELRVRTDEAIARGVFGAPATFVNGELFWGQDRLDFVERALGLEPEPPAAVRANGRELSFWYDFSSPFAYLGATQVEALCARMGAKLVWRPFLLGALFRQIGTADVPLMTFSAPKQKWVADDLARFARHYGVPFRFPSTFPIRTVLPLRVALLQGQNIGRVSQALFRAAWVEDRDIGKPEVLNEVCQEAGCDGDVVQRASADAAKAALFAATEEAARLGVCGAPCFQVDDVVFWGQDRLPLVEKALGGWCPNAG
jgi:2-hydroxychromene-2-carboxylate isomerase